MRVKYTDKEYIAKSRLKHGDTYNYSKTVYTGTNNKLTITCTIHGDFSMTANAHLNGQGCYHCGLLRRANIRKSINKTIEKNTSTKVCTKCEVEKDIVEFSPNKKLLHGVGNVCKSCNNLHLIRKRLLRRPLPMFVTHKLCSKCGECLPVKNFGSEKAKRLSNNCMRCRVEYTKLPEKIAGVRKNKEKNKLKHASKYKKLRDERNRNPAPSKLFINKMIKEDKPEDRGGLLFIACKKCGRMFNPIIMQVYCRIQSIAKPDGREGNFYCSESCKDTCDIFNQRSRRKSEIDHTKNKARTCQNAIKKELIKSQCYETGYNYCEKCGDIIDVELHHTNQVRDKGDINNPSGMMLLCAGCHVETHADCRS